MNYSEYVGLVKETNRPSGGIKTVQEVCVNAFINKSKNVLEIGCNTGFTSLNISRLTNARVTGIDLVEDSLNEAKLRAKKEGLRNIDFINASAKQLPFENESFDVVWLSNVLSFIEDKSKALEECFRVLKKNGFLIFVPIYYLKNPPKEIVKQVETAIGTKLNIQTKEGWLNFIKDFPVPTEIIYNKDYVYIDVKKDISDYLDEVFSKKHLLKIKSSDLVGLKNKGKFFMGLFNENLKYAGYSVFIIQKRKMKEERELFLTKKSQLQI